MRPLPALAAACLTTAAFAQCPDNWQQMGSTPGIRGQVRAGIAWDLDAAGPLPDMLVIAGSITGVGDQPASNVIAWDGANWHNASGAPPVGEINVLFNYNSQLLAGGVATPGLGPVLRWNGGAWETFEDIAGTECTFLATYNGALVAIGSFTDPDGVTRTQTRTWNGQWQTILLGAPSSMAEADGFLFRPVSQPGTSSYKWDGTSWTPVIHGGSLMEFVGHFVTNHNSRLVLAGQYTTMSSPYGVLQRMGVDTSWQSLPGANNRTSRLSSTGGELYALSDQQSASDFCSVRRWNGAQFEPMGQDIKQAYGVVPFQGQVLAYGAFASADRRASSGVASWSGSRWEPLPGFSGMTGFVNDIVQFRGETVIAGGLHVASAPDARILRWDGAQWQPLIPFPITRDPDTLAVHHDELFIGTRSQLTPGYWMHRWDGQQLTPVPGGYRRLKEAGGRLFGFRSWVEEYVDGGWIALGNSFNADVLDLEFYDGSLYAAGTFTANGTTNTRHVARWDRAGWVAAPGLGHPSSPPQSGQGISRLEVFDGELYGVGAVYWPDAQASRRLFAFNGLNWRAMDVSIPGFGIDFTMVADTDRLLILRSNYSDHTLFTWNGESLSPLAATTTPYPHFAQLHRASDSIILANTRAIDGVAFDAIARLVTPPCCGSADFDGDGVPGTDADIEAFFACLGGSCCPTCWSRGSDFNSDGDSGTDADIEAFFRVLAGGSC